MDIIEKGKFTYNKDSLEKGTAVQSGWSGCAKHRRAYFLLMGL